MRLRQRGRRETKGVRETRTQRQRERETDRQRDRQTVRERERERQTDRQTETRTDRQRDLSLPWLLATALMSEFVRLERTLFREHTPAGSSSISITVEVWPAQL